MQISGKNKEIRKYAFLPLSDCVYGFIYVNFVGLRGTLVVPLVL